jgi:predicted PurR-regulated permease PerM
MLKISQSQKQALSIATVLAIIFGAFFLKHYMMLIISATVVAFVFNPLYRWFMKKGRGKGSAATLTLIATFIALIIPIAFVISITAFQLVAVSENLKSAAVNTDFSELFQNAINYINHLLNNMGITYQLSESAIREGISTWLKSVLDAFLASIATFLGGIGSFVATFIIYIYVFLSILMNQDKLVETFHQLNPLGKDISKLYARRIGLMTKAMVRGQFVIATVQGFTDALLLYIAGFKSTFFFFFVILTVLSIIPLGGGVIVFPIGFIMLLTGNIWQGLLLILGHMFIVGNEDNIMRPKLVPSEARLDPALTLLSVFSGLAFFGFIGIVLGPVIMIVLVTTIQVYLEVFKNIKQPKILQSDKKLVDKLKFWQKDSNPA